MSDNGLSAILNVPQSQDGVLVYLQTIAPILMQKLQEAASAGQEITHVEPDKLTIGMVRYADGSDWNPGSGAGLYVYTASGWQIANQDLSSYATTAALVARLPTGSIQMWGTASAPTGYLLCDGSAVSRTTYADLFAVISTTFGTGDGSTTFNLPNFQGVVPRGVGSQTINGRSKSGPSLGATQEDQVQGHYHTVRRKSDGAKEVLTSVTGGSNPRITAAAANATDESEAQDIITDGTNGTPRTGTETRGNALGVNFIIKT